MDGNGRWAKKRFMPRVAGHVKGVELLREMVRACLERGVQYLRKQPDPAPYQNALKKFEEQLARANALVLETSKPSSSQTSELDAGLDSLGGDDEWKKKNIYD